MPGIKYVKRVEQLGAELQPLPFCNTEKFREHHVPLVVATAQYGSFAGVPKLSRRRVSPDFSSMKRSEQRLARASDR
jgi:hypothetical protein